MKKCKHCKDFNEEKYAITIDEIRIQGSYYHYSCPIKFCPACGSVLNKYVKGDESKKSVEQLIELRQLKKKIRNSGIIHCDDFCNLDGWYHEFIKGYQNKPKEMTT